MAQSLFIKLRQQSAACRITVLSPEWTRPVLERMPEVAETVAMPVGHGALEIGIRRRLGRELRAREFGQAIVLPGSFKSALVPFFAKIPRRTGYRGEMRFGVLNDLRRLDKSRLPTTVQRFVNLAGGPQPGLPDCPRPRLSHDMNRARAAAHEHGHDTTRPLLVLCPGAEYGPAKRWPVQRFAELARRRHRQGWQVWLMGSQKDRETCDCIDHLSERSCVNLAGATTLTDAVDLLGLADAVVTNDSGLMHLAAALRRPLVCIYGSSSPEMTPPLTETAELVWLRLDCAPCFRRHCPLGHLDCLNHISARQVDEALIRLESSG